MIFRKFYLAAIPLILAVAGYAQTQPDSGAIAQVRGYLLGPGDVISVKVLGEKDFDFAARVDENGNVQLPYSEKTLPAKCRSQDEITTDVRNYLKTYIREPQINLQISERNSRPPVTIYGEVHQPSEITLTRKATLATILAIAHGVTDEAGGVIEVFRNANPVCEEDFGPNLWKTDKGDPISSKLFSLAALQNGGDSNPLILPGDMIMVHPASPVFITGEVVEPTSRFIRERGLRLLEAISQVGGVRQEAKTKDVKIYRAKPGSDQREEISANLDLIKKGQQPDVPLKPYDIIVVDKAKDSVGMQMFKYAIGLGKATLDAAGTASGYAVPRRVIY